MRLIVGLGNPGRTYAHNRHNIGAMCVAKFARTSRIPLDKKQGLARTGTGEVSGHRVVLARPQTYMNISGESVVRLANRFDIAPDKLVVIYDDLDLPLGTIRLRQGGGSGGHKGINSIISQLGSEDFCRIKIGIGRPDTEGTSVKDKEAEIIKYVLSDFTPEEKKIIDEVISMVDEAIFCLITEGLAAAMNTYN